MEVIYRQTETLKKLENNPRTISEEQLRKLKESIQNNPDYFEARPIILSDRTGELVIIAGNQRYDACVQLGMKQVPTVLIPNLTEDREKEIIIRDNVNNGERDVSRLFAQKSSERKETHDYRSKAIFLDANNFTANFRFGEWYFQHYHSTADICRLTREYIGNGFRIYEKGIETDSNREMRGSSFQVSCINERKAGKDEYMKALQYEFSLPLPNNRRWDLDKEILPVFEKL